MPEAPSDVRDLAAAREAARAAKDFPRADDLRDQIRRRGWVVRDTPAGSVLEPEPIFEQLDPATIPDRLADAPSVPLSFQLLYEDHPEDLERFLRGFEQHNPVGAAEVVVVDNASADAERIEMLVKPRPWARALHLDRELGWAAARNAGLRDARGAIVTLVDLSIEPTGNIVDPLRAALEDERVAVAGPYGLISEDMRSWRDAPGEEAHAIQGYLLAVRRELLATAGLLEERFEWYRNADIDLSFQLRAASGGRARVVPLPVRKHEHRSWAALEEQERERRSKRNYALFLERWRARADLLRST